MVRRRRPQLLTMADYKTANFIAKALHRSENAVRYRLAVLGKSSRFHLEGYARRTLAQELHLGSRTIQRLIAEGLLEVRDPRIARKSLEEACARRQLPTSLHDLQPRPRELGCSCTEKRLPQHRRTIPHQLLPATSQSHLVLVAPSEFGRTWRGNSMWTPV